MASSDHFDDRRQAGRLLARQLRHYAGRDDVVVLGLPRGGVPVAFEIAQALEAPLDVYLVRKLGVPGHEELAFGAIATGGIRVLNRQVVDALDLPREWIEAIVAKEMHELERREREYRGDRPPPDLTGRTAILVDDGLATGSTMMAAVRAAREDDPERVVVAVPVAPREVIAALREDADEVVCLLAPSAFGSVGSWYRDFSQTGDEEVKLLLARSRRPPVPGPPEILHRIEGTDADWDRLVERAADADFVLIGEASHGTHEFYDARARITRRLIAEQGFDAVAVEADWPDAYRVNRFVRGFAEDAGADEALSDFRRFPTWMWRNTVVADFAEWLRERNTGLPEGARTGFYGLDLYSLHRSAEEVIAFLEDVDPDAAARARERYSCFDHFGRDPQVYAYETGLAGAEPCEQQAVEELLELRELAAQRDAHGLLDADEAFYAEQNARLVVDAERYYRASFRGGIESWNLRDSHMGETLDALAGHLGRAKGAAPRIVVWAHNSHLGDARATELGASGELNLGQLARERYGKRALLVGFSTDTGTVTAASDWGSPAQRVRVRPALDGSWEDLFHRMDVPDLMIGTGGLEGRRLERAIGVIYRPQTERRSHYFHARIEQQFDVVIHFDETTALEPLDINEEWTAGAPEGPRELPETYPFGV